MQRSARAKLVTYSIGRSSRRLYRKAGLTAIRAILDRYCGGPEGVQARRALWRRARLANHPVRAFAHPVFVPYATRMTASVRVNRPVASGNEQIDLSREITG